MRQLIDNTSALLCVHVSYEVVSVIADTTPTITKVRVVFKRFSKLLFELLIAGDGPMLSLLQLFQCLTTHFGLVCDEIVCFLIDCISPLDSVPAPDTTVVSCLQAILYITGTSPKEINWKSPGPWTTVICCSLS